MRGTLLGTLGGLIIGTLGTLAYSHYVEGGALPPVQAEAKPVNSANAGNGQEMKSEVDALSAQLQQLTTTNDDLKHQLDAAKSAPPPGPPPINPMLFVGMMRGGGQTQQRVLLLKTRLHLTAEQEAAVKTAMEADARQKMQLMRQMFRGNQGNGQTPATPTTAINPNSLDQTLEGILSPDQMASYKQVQAEVKTSQADTAATAQVNQVTPLLQLSDSQKDQVYNALYQVQSTAPDPTSLIGNPDAASILAAQTKATEAALGTVLTPAQMALYQQEEAATPRFGGRGGRGGGGGTTPAATSAPQTPAAQ